MVASSCEMMIIPGRKLIVFATNLTVKPGVLSRHLDFGISNLRMRMHTAFGAPPIAHQVRAHIYYAYVEMSVRGRGGHGASLGMNSARLRGGFLASMLPRSSAGTHDRDRSTNSTTTLTQRYLTRGIELTTTSTTSSDDLNDNSNLDSALSSVSGICKTIREQTRRIEQKLTVVEQWHSTAIKELTSLIQKQEKDSFSIKGSSYDV